MIECELSGEVIVLKIRLQLVFCRGFEQGL